MAEGYSPRLASSSLSLASLRRGRNGPLCVIGRRGRRAIEPGRWGERPGSRATFAPIRQDPFSRRYRKVTFQVILLTSRG